jgi:hypothetical protein
LFVLGMIFVSCVCLVLDNPLLDPDSPLKRSLDLVDLALTCIFIVEATLKIAALGLLFETRGSYLRDAWNLIGPSSAPPLFP